MKWEPSATSVMEDTSSIKKGPAVTVSWGVLGVKTSTGALVVRKGTFYHGMAWGVHRVGLCVINVRASTVAKSAPKGLIMKMDNV